jgi:hypothetical protein
MMGGVSSETCWASYKYEIKFDTLLHLVGFFIWIILWCMDPRTSTISYHISYHHISYIISSYIIPYISYRISYHISYHIYHIIIYHISYHIYHIYIISYHISLNSLGMTKTDRNVSQLWQIVCKKCNFNIGAFVDFTVWTVSIIF